VRERYVDVVGPREVPVRPEEAVALGQDVEDARAARRGLDLFGPLGLLTDTALLALATPLLAGWTASAVPVEFPAILTAAVLVPVLVAAILVAVFAAVLLALFAGGRAALRAGTVFTAAARE